MKNLNRFIVVLLCGLTFYQMYTAKSDMDLVLGILLLLMAIIFMCFVIIEEQKEEITELKRKRRTQDPITKDNIEVFTVGDGQKYFRVK